MYRNITRFFLGFFLLLNSHIYASNANWMQSYKLHIQNKPLNKIFIPGTHDSATYKLENTIAKGQNITHKLNALKYIGGIGYGVAKIIRKWALAQSRTILEQLEDGNRFLDLRVVYRDSQKAFYTAHGLYGPSLKEVLTQIMTFINAHPQEIIIVQVGGMEYMPESKGGGHKKLIKQLRDTFKDKLALKKQGATVTIGELWRQKKQIVLIFDQSDIARPYEDIWERDDFFESYWANATTFEDLKQKLDEHLKDRDTKYGQMFYVVQSQLTPDGNTIKKGLNVFSKNPKSLKDLANVIKREFPQWLDSWKDQDPNIIMIDFADAKSTKAIYQLNLKTMIDQLKTNKLYRRHTG